MTTNNTVDCIVGYHLNPLICGIAKFNQELAERLGVPILGLFDERVRTLERIIVSIKLSEFDLDDIGKLEQFAQSIPDTQRFDLFLHDYSGTDVEKTLIAKARWVYCGNIELYERISQLTDRAVEVWCPGTLHEAKRFEPAELKVFTFGMAHKIKANFYRRLDELLKATGKSYCLYLSTALHEGTTFENDFQDAFIEMQEVFSGPVYFLGFLSDTAVFNYLNDCTYFAAFFQGGVRANNTSVNTAMTYGLPVITNLDRFSPSHYKHGINIIDIVQTEVLMHEPTVLNSISRESSEISGVLGWDKLTECISEHDSPIYQAGEHALSVKHVSKRGRVM